MTWQKVLQPITQSSYYHQLLDKVHQEYANYHCFPPENQIFRALELTPFDEVKVVVLGQDPYHDDHQANGLAFSVSNKVKTPPSLKNIYKELYQDLGIVRNSNELDDWAKQGVLLLNATLTVRAHQANSHQHLDWGQYTDFIIQSVSEKHEKIVFVLWGSFAQKKVKLIDEKKHFIIQSAHPSPLSAYRGFFGSQPFSKINAFLRDQQKEIIHWEDAVASTLF
jgi:uracil-DNA glycosylase